MDGQYFKQYVPGGIVSDVKEVEKNIHFGFKVDVYCFKTKRLNVPVEGTDMLSFSS